MEREPGQELIKAQQAGSDGIPPENRNTVKAEQPVRPREIGGPKGPEPTRYGDWERAGRCVDF